MTFDKIYIFDIDGVICSSEGIDYEDAIPDKSMISIINHLYDKGYRIIIMTGRGATSGIDRKELTLKQLNEWNVKHHELKFINKPREYLYVDDKACSPEEFLNRI